jgi:hypothetical protein
MNDRIDDLERRLGKIEQRLAELEKRGVAPAGPGAEVRELEVPGFLGDESLSSGASHLGRVLLIFGGAYLLRAVTDAGFVSVIAGIPIGAAYALFWLAWGYRVAAASSSRIAGTIYVVLSIILFLPLVVEAVIRFELLGAVQAALALVVFCALTLVVCVRRSLQIPAWLVVGGTMLTALLLLKEARAATIFAGVLLLVGAGSLWLVYLRRWHGLQWLGALGADAAVILLAALGANDNWPVGPGVAFYFGLAVWVFYFSSFVARSFVLRREAGLFEFVQLPIATLLVVAVMLIGGGLSEGHIAFLGLSAVLVGPLCYALMFTPEIRSNRGRAYYLYSILAPTLVIAGTAILLPAGLTGVVLAIMAVGAAWVSGRWQRVTLSLHATVYLLAAAWLSGALTVGYQALVSDPMVWPAVSASHVVVALATVLCLFIPVAQNSERWGALAGLPQLIVLILSIWVVGGLLVALVAPWIAGVPGADTDRGLLATLRTAILAASAVVLAVTSRYPRWPEARHLAYPILAAAGIKLLFEDLPHGRPLTLFLAFALLGIALILVARLLPRQRKVSPMSVESESPAPAQPAR